MPEGQQEIRKATRDTRKNKQPIKRENVVMVPPLLCRKHIYCVIMMQTTDYGFNKNSEITILGGCRPVRRGQPKRVKYPLILTL